MLKPLRRVPHSVFLVVNRSGIIWRIDRTNALRARDNGREPQAQCEQHYTHSFYCGWVIAAGCSNGLNVAETRLFAPSASRISVIVP